MISSTNSKRLMIAMALLGALAVLTGVILGVGATNSRADAAPVSEPLGTLGIGDELIAPIAAPVDADDKIVVTDSTSMALAMTTPAVLAVAPVAVAAKAPVRRASTTKVSRAAANSDGWKSARVSWYGPGFYGRKTASGAVLTQGMMNVAHRSLPFGTRIQFEYKGRTCIAVVNDRGPFVGGRTFDLGPGTATALGFGGVGTVKYRILGR
ncbi:MAG: septal ring lytic transglycosylase RlpA family protein [Coriobacteriia bacterium]|nr:septal ring lytic transglycosylase RlpA family protein [Coriobacteriia bacterium]